MNLTHKQFSLFTHCQTPPCLYFLCKDLNRRQRVPGHNSPICSPSWIRTNGRRFRKPVLYPAELWNHYCKITKIFYSSKKIIQIITLFFFDHFFHHNKIFRNLVFPFKLLRNCQHFLYAKIEFSF